MTERSFLRSFSDRLALVCRGGTRIRVVKAGGALGAFAIGDVALRPRPERLRRLVLDLDPPGPGIVHVTRRDRGLRVRCKGALRDAGFEQRLRNALAAL